MYYKVRIDKTAKDMGSKEGVEGYHIFDQEIKNFKTLDEIRVYLDEQYGKCKKVKMYIDTKKGESKQKGWIYCFRNSDVSHNSKPWYQQDWVSVSEIQEKEILV